jgi:hypothetical protein
VESIAPGLLRLCIYGVAEKAIVGDANALAATAGTVEHQANLTIIC